MEITELLSQLSKVAVPEDLHLTLNPDDTWSIMDDQGEHLDIEWDADDAAGSLVFRQAVESYMEKQKWNYQTGYLHTEPHSPFSLWVMARTKGGEKSRNWLPKNFWHMIQPCYRDMRALKFEVGDILTFHNNFTLRIATVEGDKSNFDQGTVWATPRTHCRIREEMLGGTVIKLTRGDQTIWEYSRRTPL